MKNKPLKERLHKNGIKLVSLARSFGVDKATISRWVQGSIPAERVIEFERLTNISRHELRPDVFGKKGEAA